jgi:DASH complex subunit DAD1
MSSGTTRPPASSSTTAQPAEKTFFEQQREVLLKEIGVVSYQEWVEGAGCEVLTRGQSFEHVLANINKLNRAMEGVIAVS